jgi:hypothetical protein
MIMSIINGIYILVSHLLRLQDSTPAFFNAIGATRTSPLAESGLAGLGRPMARTRPSSLVACGLLAPQPRHREARRVIQGADIPSRLADAASRPCQSLSRNGSFLESGFRRWRRSSDSPIVREARSKNDQRMSVRGLRSRIDCRRRDRLVEFGRALQVRSERGSVLASVRHDPAQPP